MQISLALFDKKIIFIPFYTHYLMELVNDA